MNSAFGEIFLFLTDLAWKSRVTIPILVTTAFLVMDIRLQIEINIQSGQVAAAELEQFDDTDDDDDDDDDDDIDDYTITDDSSNADDNCADYNSNDGADEERSQCNNNTSNSIKRTLGLS